MQFCVNLLENPSNQNHRAINVTENSMENVLRLRFI